MEPRRDADRNTPGTIRRPARVAQIIGDRGERVVLAVPDVGIPVPVAVHGQAKVDGGEELRIAGGAGPTDLQAAARDAAVDKLQGLDELVREESPAPALVGEAGERVQKVEIAGDGAIAGFMTQDGDPHRVLHAITAADGVEPADMAGIAGAAPAYQPRRPLTPPLGGA